MSELVSYRLSLVERVGILMEKPYLDVHVADHCNLRCAGCVHFAPLAGRTLQMSEGRIWPCQVAAHHGTLNKRFGLDMCSQPEDSLAIADIASTDQIEELRRHPHPMCRYCDMEHLSVAEWRMSSFEAGEWLKGR